MTYEELQHILNTMEPEVVQDYLNAFKSQDLYYVNPWDAYTEPLEKHWDEFNSMTKPFMRRSDWVQLQYIGISNEEIYNILKTELLKGISTTYNLDFIHISDMEHDENYDDSILKESTYVAASEDVDYEAIIGSRLSTWEKRLELAKQWCKETGYIMILPVGSTSELEDMWDAFNLMTLKHRRVSDWKCLELFGLTNLQMYKMEKSTMLVSPVKDDATPGMFIDGDSEHIDIPFSEAMANKIYFRDAIKNESGCEIARSLCKLLNEKCDGKKFDQIIAKSIIESTITDYNNLTGNYLNVQINYSDMPMFSPDEMIDMGVFGHEPIENYFNGIGNNIINGDDTVLEWFNKYRMVYNGLPIDEEFNRINLERVRKLNNIYKTTTHEQRISDPNMAQHILEMGWNPLYDFDPKTRVKADKRINSFIESNFGESKIIDLRGFRTLKLEKFALNEKTSVSVNDKFLKPIYLVFEEGDAFFSHAIKKFTHGLYSHAAISFDTSMEKMYSYSIEGSENGVIGGFVIENIKNKPKDLHIGIYAVFVDSSIWDTIYNNVMHFAQNVKKTTYSYANILTILFQIPYEKSNSLICSQFVDRMLKLGGIDITGKKPSQVDPNYLYRSSKANKNIYRLFEGKFRNFNAKKLYDRTYGLLNKISKYKTECAGIDLMRESVFYHDDLNTLNSMYENDHMKNLPTLKSIYETFYTPCLEAKEIPIRFDNEGDLLVSPFPMDYKSEYAKSHKLLMEYEKKKNYEGMKSELAKLWMMYITIERKLRLSRFNSYRVKYLNDSKAHILNDFKKYLDIVMDHEKDFDFESYYIKSQYSDNNYRIGKNTIKHTIDLIKTVI